jgi:hypothetical protein
MSITRTERAREKRQEKWCEKTGELEIEKDACVHSAVWRGCSGISIYLYLYLSLSFSLFISVYLSIYLSINIKINISALIIPLSVFVVDVVAGSPHS